MNNNDKKEQDWKDNNIEDRPQWLEVFFNSLENAKGEKPVSLEEVASLLKQTEQSKLPKLINELNQADFLILLPLLLYPREKNQTLIKLLEEKLPVGFWKEFGSQPIFPCGGYDCAVQIKKEVKLRPDQIPVGFQEVGEARASSRSGAYIEYVSSEMSTQQSQNLKGDGYISVAVIMGIYCDHLASIYEQAAQCLSEAINLLTDDQESFFIENSDCWDRVSRFLAEAQGNMFNRELANIRIELGSRVAIFHEKMSCKTQDRDINEIETLKETIFKLKKELLKIGCDCRRNYSNNFFSCLTLGHHWNNFSCAERLCAATIAKKGSYDLPDYLCLLLKVIVLIATPAKKQHWGKGHLLYADMLSHVINAFETLGLQSLDAEVKTKFKTLSSTSVFPKNWPLIIQQCCKHALENIKLGHQLSQFISSRSVLIYSEDFTYDYKQEAKTREEFFNTFSRKYFNY